MIRDGWIVCSTSSSRTATTTRHRNNNEITILFPKKTLGITLPLCSLCCLNDILNTCFVFPFVFFFFIQYLEHESYRPCSSSLLCCKLIYNYKICLENLENSCCWVGSSLWSMLDVYVFLRHSSMHPSLPSFNFSLSMEHCLDLLFHIVTSQFQLL